jgi:peptidoglycan/LPS O-acetylase OafA/YrhL
MRALAALSVVFYHVTFVFPGPSSELVHYLSQRNAGPPITGVVLFFLISGFVLYRPFVQARFEGEPMPALVPYAVRRVARIVPGYWLALAIVGIWLGLHELASASGVIRYFGFLQLYGTFSTANRGISAAWSLCVEITFYATLPMFALAVRRVRANGSPLRSELALCAVLALVSLVWQAVICSTVANSNGLKVPLLWTLPGSLDLFAAGMALAVLSVATAQQVGRPRWVELIDRAPWALWLAALALFYAVGQVSALRRYGYGAWWIPSHELKALGSALLLIPVIFGSDRRGWLRRALAWPPLLWLGTISYGIYLWHKPLLDKLGPHLVGHGEILATLVVSAASVAFAAVSFYAVERPAQRLARRYLSDRAARAQQPAAALGAVVVPGGVMGVPPDTRA